MGMYTSAYHFYGVHVPKDQWSQDWAAAEGELIDTALQAVSDLAPDVRYITAGNYDQDMLFLAIHQPGIPTEVPVGEFVKITERNVRNLGWDAQLWAVIQAMGYKDIDVPGWIFVPDVS